MLTISQIGEDQILLNVRTSFASFQLTFWFVMFFLAPGWALFAKFPDELDQLACAGLAEGAIDHCRSPLTHHPLTLGYWIVPLLIPASEYTKLLQLPAFFLPPDERSFLTISSGFVSYVAIHLIVVWGSHLFLDALNPSGLPTGRKSVYAPRLLRHCAWKELRPNVPSWRLAHIRFDDKRWNQMLSLLGLAISVIIIGNEILRRLLLFPGR